MEADLERLTAKIRACRICVDNPVGRPLPHEPRPVLRPSSSARILLAGQAPGTKVHLSGMPFTDASGDRLRSWLGVTSEEFYDTEKFAIVPMGFCFPGQDAKGGDLPPRRECAETWRAPIFAALPRLELILTIGGYAQSWHLGPDCESGLTATVKRWRAIVAAPRRPRILPMPHPSWRNNGWLRKNPWFEAELVPALQNEVRALLA